MEGKLHMMEVQLGKIDEVRAQMKSVAVQVNKNHWSYSCATQTNRKVVYDQCLQAELGEKLTSSNEPNEQQVREIAELKRSIQMMEAMAVAKDSEKDSAMDQLRQVIDAKEQLIQEL